MLSEADEIQLAGELLEVTNEAELDRFLGDFIKKVGSVAGQVIRSPVGQAVGGVLKGVAKKALPMAGGAIGGYFGGPLGAKIGSGLASAAGSALGLEAEQLEQEDREFEGAKQFVKVAADTVTGGRLGAAGLRSAGSGPGSGRRGREEVRARPCSAQGGARAARPARVARAADGCAAATRSFSTACEAMMAIGPYAHMDAGAGGARPADPVGARQSPSPWSSRCCLRPTFCPARRTRSSAISSSADASSARPCVTSSYGCAGRRQDRRRRPRRSVASPSCKLRFNAVITQFDLFNDVISQRSENEIGVWMSGLDVVSADALALPGGYYEVPPIICYLDRGIGAAIRRARTRLPGGGANPVAIIRVPRERMIGSGIASSLFHEVGHQAAALLDLVNSLRPVLQGLQRGRASERAGLAAVGALDLRDRRRLLVGGASRRRRSTMGLMGVVSLPRAVRVPPQRRRSASGALDPRQAELRDGQRALSASAVGASRRSLGVALPDRRARARTPAAAGAACRTACPAS